MNRKLPPLVLERLAHGELSSAEAERARAELGDDADAAVQALLDDDAATLAAHPPAQVAAEVRRRLARVESIAAPRPSPARWWIPGIALVATGALAWLIVRPIPGGEAEHRDGPLGDPRGVILDDDGGLGDTVDPTRIKGMPQLTIERMGARGPERLGDGDLAGDGDLLQLQYRAAGREQGVIVSIDGRGTATLHFPATADASTRLRTGGLVPLDHSYELDDAPRFERFFLVTAPRGGVVDVDTVVHAAQALAHQHDAETARLPLPAELEQQIVTLRKR